MHAPRLASLLLALPLLLPAQADTLTSSASSLASKSVSSISDSISDSSTSSGGGGDGKAAVVAGTYRVVAATPMAPDRMALALVAQDDSGHRFQLALPAALARAQGLTEPGALVNAEARAYGLAFARPAAPVFFLALHDAWLRDLDVRALR